MGGEEEVVIKRGVSLLGFSAGQYYHFLLEGLSRLLLFVDELPDAEGGYTLLLPQSEGSYIEEILNLLPASLLQNKFTKFVVHDPSVKLLVEELWHADWRFVEGEEKEGCRRGEGRELLPPTEGLKRIRSVFTGNNGDNGGPHSGRESLVLVLRPQDATRSFVNEAAVVEGLEMLSSSLNLDLVLFRGEDSGVKAAVDVFHRAAIVVGVHGGGLANVVFCRQGALVIEIGMSEWEFRGMYGNIAQAVGVNHKRYSLELPSLFESRIAVDVEDMVGFVHREIVLRAEPGSK